MTYRRARIKFKLEQIGMFPFVLAGKLYGKLFPYKGPESIQRTQKIMGLKTSFTKQTYQ
jgi:hypothetical protein